MLFKMRIKDDSVQIFLKQCVKYQNLMNCFYRSTVKSTVNKKPWSEKTLQGLIMLVGCRGLEPRTDGLRVHCSTN